MEEEHWYIRLWRPSLGWLYALICLFDFMGAQIMLTVYAKMTGTPVVLWHPNTTEGAAVFHMAFLSILTATSWQRSNEKMEQIKATTMNPKAEPTVTTTTTVK